MGGEEKDGKEDTVLGEGGAVCLLFTGHPRHWAPTDSYDSRPAQTRRLFCESLVAFVPRRVVPVQLPRHPFSSSRRARCSSTFFFHRFFHSLFTAPPLSSFSVSGLDINVALISCPCFHRVRVLLFSFRFSSLSPSRFASLYLFLPPSLLALPLSPLPCFPRPYILRPVVAFFWSLFPRIELVFLPARRQVRGWLENGENGRTGTRMRMRG